MINRPIQINKYEVKNRIAMPALVCFHWADQEGFETYDRGVHYGKRAKGGTGLIIVEATAISKEGRLADTELGLWRDGHIPQFQKLAASAHAEGAVVIIQLVHAGRQGVGPSVYSSSSASLAEKECHAMSAEQIEQVKRDFVSAAIRAKQAGLDGVEIHGAHGYLLSQFTSKEVNDRSDQYGGSLDNRLRLSLDILTAIREAVGKEFILCYRLGVNDPTMEEDRYFARKLEQIGVDLLNVSSGIGANNLEMPEISYDPITYMGTEIYKEVDIPVICVFGIRDPKQAEYLLENDLIDMVAVGRGLLADPEWTNKAIAKDKINICYHCKPRCRYVIDGRECPWYSSF